MTAIAVDLPDPIHDALIREALRDGTTPDRILRDLATRHATRTTAGGHPTRSLTTVRADRLDALIRAGVDDQTIANRLGLPLETVTNHRNRTKETP